MSARAVVITGIGPVSAIGIGREAFAAALAAGQSGIRTVDRFDPAPYRARLAAPLTDFAVEDYLESQKTYLDRGTELAFAAASLALEDAGLDLRAADRDRVGLCLGTALGSLDTMRLFFDDFLKKGPRLVKPFLFPHAYANTAISLVAIEYGLTGYHNCLVSGATAGAAAILDAADRIREGRCDAALAGGFEAFGEVLFALLDARGELSAAAVPGAWAGPFDARRDGFVPGEGAAIVVLESREHAAARGATVLAELAGGGAAGDRAGEDPGGGAARAMRQALADAGAAPESLDGVIASANGSVAGDRAEAAAIRAVLGAAGRAPATSVKPLVGETLGASGALQASAAVTMLQSGFMPAIHSLERPDPACEARLAREPIAAPLDALLVNALDAGGAAVSLVLRR